MRLLRNEAILISSQRCLVADLKYSRKITYREKYISKRNPKLAFRLMNIFTIFSREILYFIMHSWIKSITVARRKTVCLQWQVANRKLVLLAVFSREAYIAHLLDTVLSVVGTQHNTSRLTRVTTKASGYNGSLSNITYNLMNIVSLDVLLAYEITIIIESIQNRLFDLIWY